MVVVIFWVFFCVFFVFIAFMAGYLLSMYREEDDKQQKGS